MLPAQETKKKLNYGNVSQNIIRIYFDNTNRAMIHNNLFNDENLELNTFRKHFNKG